MRWVGLAALLVFGYSCSEPVTVRWKRKLQAPSVSTPLVTPGFIAVGDEVGVSIIERDGTPRCVFATLRDVISAPKTDGKLIFFGSTNYIVYAIDSGCKEIWKFPTRDRIKSDPLVADGKVVVSSYDGHVYALNAVNGQLVWAFPAEPSIRASPAAPASVEPTEKSRAKAKARGKKRDDEAPAPVPAPAAPAAKPVVVGDFSYSSPVLANGVIYVGNLDHNVYGIDAQTGALRAVFKTGGSVTSTPLVEAGTLYFGSNDGNLYAIDLATNAERWKFATQDWINSSPRLVDGVVYVGSNDRNVYAIDAASGRLRWKFTTDGPAISIPVPYKNLLIVAGASGDGSLYALQRQTGSLVWRYKTGGKIESDPVVDGDQLIVSSGDQYLYSFVLIDAAVR